MRATSWRWVWKSSRNAARSPSRHRATREGTSLTGLILPAERPIGARDLAQLGSMNDGQVAADVTASGIFRTWMQVRASIFKKRCLERRAAETYRRRVFRTGP